MGVSRETLQPFSRLYADILKKPAGASLDLSDVGLLGLLLPQHGGAFLLVDDDDFESVFYLLYKKSLPSFCVLTNKSFDAPLGFEGALDRFKNNFSLYSKSVDIIILIDRSTFESGGAPVYKDAEVFDVNSTTSYGALLGALDRASYWRCSCVSKPGDFAVRGSVVDFFSRELSFPVRVDFSYNSPLLFVFDLNSQITTRKIRFVSFLVFSGGFEVVSLSKVLKNLTPLNFSSSVLSWGKTPNPLLSLKVCDYATYRKTSVSPVVSLDLDSFGVFVDDSLFVPGWFIKSGPGRPTPAPSLCASDGFNDIAVGDYLVHDDYGVGLFCGMLEDAGEDSYLQLEYVDAKINVHVSQIALLSFFAGPLSSGVVLNSISKRGSWNRKKLSISKKIESFVESLYKQHLARISSSKNRLGVDFDLLTDFVSSFSFVDTEDQAAAYKEILSDLTSPLPMDRLLCGDVGFGKTELAIRASFISVLQGERVVLLCPTTVLCHQLFRSFRSRLSSFSVAVGSVSRLNSSLEVQNNVALFNSNRLDVLICTHRIFHQIKSLSNVGLLVIDEEHRFGVKQKELFVEAFPEIDVLMMSATPIPRSLQSALSGIKAMSIISTPPINRVPIETSVEYYNIDRVINYIRFEVSRGGQVYFLHNNILSLNKFKRVLLSKLDGVRVETIHAKMSPKKIKEVLGSFVLRSFDVLVATSIIENGLDIPNVNTVIINNAHLFGLSQLHQIRGRVGRHHRQAFAHLLIPRSLQLKGDSFRRLKAIEENVALGSGYVLSAKDLEIRGAGSVFGYAQSGGALVGFDFYNKLVHRAVSKKSLGFGLDRVCVNLYGSSAIIPSDYIEDSVLRLSLYRRLSLIDGLDLLGSFSLELKDRFGSPPGGVDLLIKSQGLKILCHELSVLSLVLLKKECSVLFVPSKKLEDLPVFLSGVDSFFSRRGVSYKFKKQSSGRLLLRFGWGDKNKDILVFISDFLNNFKNGFLS
jgi:transcription-repair coupling factor (superfamily II helicase)